MSNVARPPSIPPSSLPTPETPAAAPAPDRAPLVDLADPAARAVWLDDVRAQVGDAIAAGLDATAPPGARDLGRRKARRIIQEAGEKLTALLAVVGLPGATEEGAP